MKFISAYLCQQHEILHIIILHVKIRSHFFFIERYVANILPSILYILCITRRRPSRPKHVVMNNESWKIIKI